MHKSLKALLVATALAGASIVGTTSVASAQPTGFSFRVGDVAFGYQNGYYDRSNRWHNWRNERERAWYRNNYRKTFVARNYDRDRDGVPNWADRRPNNPYRR